MVRIKILLIVSLLVISYIDNVHAGTLEFEGVPVDVTTANNEDLVIVPGTGGNTQVGDATGTNEYAISNDDLHVTGVIESEGLIHAEGGILSSSHIIPLSDSLYNLGSANQHWSNLYIDNIRSATTDLIFRINVDGTDAEVIRIDGATGNVGIKTTSPEYNLDVTGDINLSGQLYQGGNPFVTGHWTLEGNDVSYDEGNVNVGGDLNIKGQIRSAEGSQYMLSNSPLLYSENGICYDAQGIGLSAAVFWLPSGDIQPYMVPWRALDGTNDVDVGLYNIAEGWLIVTIFYQHGEKETIDSFLDTLVQGGQFSAWQCDYFAENVFVAQGENNDYIWVGDPKLEICSGYVDPPTLTAEPLFATQLDMGTGDLSTTGSISSAGLEVADQLICNGRLEVRGGDESSIEGSLRVGGDINIGNPWRSLNFYGDDGGCSFSYDHNSHRLHVSRPGAAIAAFESGVAGGQDGMQVFGHMAVGSWSWLNPQDVMNISENFTGTFPDWSMRTAMNFNLIVTPDNADDVMINPYAVIGSSTIDLRNGSTNWNQLITAADFSSRVLVPAGEECPGSSYGIQSYMRGASDWDEGSPTGKLANVVGGFFQAEPNLSTFGYCNPLHVGLGSWDIGGIDYFVGIDLGIDMYSSSFITNDYVGIRMRQAGLGDSSSIGNNWFHIVMDPPDTSENHIAGNTYGLYIRKMDGAGPGNNDYEIFLEENGGVFFRNINQSIRSKNPGQLDLDAATSINLNANTINVSGTPGYDGTIPVTGGDGNPCSITVVNGIITSTNCQ